MLDVVGEYVFNFYDCMVGLIGIFEQVDVVFKVYCIYYKVYDDGIEFYLVDYLVQFYFNILGMGVVDFFGCVELFELVVECMVCVIDKIS